MNKIVALFFLFLMSVPLVSAQEIVQEKSKTDSSNIYIAFLDRQNKKIADAYALIGTGLKAQKPDSLVQILLDYKNTCLDVYTTVSYTIVDDYLASVRIAYLQWIRSINDFNDMYLMKLEEYHYNKWNLQQADPEADTRYANQKIIEFFEQMDSSQSIYRNLYMQELDNLKRFLEEDMKHNK